MTVENEAPIWHQLISFLINLLRFAVLILFVQDILSNCETCSMASHSVTSGTSSGIFYIHSGCPVRGFHHHFIIRKPLVHLNFSHYIIMFLNQILLSCIFTLGKNQDFIVKNNRFSNLLVSVIWKMDTQQKLTKGTCNHPHK